MPSSFKDKAKVCNLPKTKYWRLQQESWEPCRNVSFLCTNNSICSTVNNNNKSFENANTILTWINYRMLFIYYLNSLLVNVLTMSWLSLIGSSVQSRFWKRFYSINDNCTSCTTSYWNCRSPIWLLWGGCFISISKRKKYILDSVSNLYNCFILFIFWPRTSSLFSSFYFSFQ